MKELLSEILQCK